MTVIKAIIATTALDAHNEIMTRECLEGLVSQISEYTILMNMEHDPRRPPLGRIISGKIVKINNIDYGVEAEIELFDEEFDYNDTFKDRPLRCEDDIPQGTIRFAYDRNFENEDDQKVIDDLSKISKTKPVYQVKKALDPLSIFEIGGGFALGCIASGFFGQIGADGYISLKEKLKKLFPKEKVGEKERLLEFSFSVIKGDKTINCKVILTNPYPEEIDQLLDRGLKELDSEADSYFGTGQNFKLVVFEYKKMHLEPIYAVTNDGVPYTIERRRQKGLKKDK